MTSKPLFVRLTGSTQQSVHIVGSEVNHSLYEVGHAKGVLSR